MATTDKSVRLDKYGRRRIVTVYATFVIYAICLFSGAGTLRWGEAWAYLAVGVLITTGVAMGYRHMSAVINARGRNNMPQERWDRIIMSIYTPLPLLQYVLTGMDAVRWGWSTVPEGWRALGWALAVGSMVFIYWAMASNPFLETTVRIQEERGHQVTDRGPYRWVRHPMYMGMIASLIGTPLLLGSWWGLIPAALGSALLITRTAREDAMLQRELAGYAEYAQRTRARLFPGVW